MNNEFVQPGTKGTPKAFFYFCLCVSRRFLWFHVIVRNIDRSFQSILPYVQEGFVMPGLKSGGVKLTPSFRFACVVIAPYLSVAVKQLIGCVDSL